MQAKEIKIGSIIIGERFREDLGELSNLVESIKDKGVIQPITIDDAYNLLAGRRRIEASREAGLKTIPCVIRSVHGELDAREIELFENIHRQDFTWVERAKLEERIFELKKEKDPNWSIRKQGKETESGYGAVQRRLALAKAIETIPELADSKTAEEAWKKYKRLEENAVIQLLKQKGEEKYTGAAKFAEGHYIIGDAWEGLKKVNPGVVDFAEVDPPYGVELVKRKSRNIDDKNIKKYDEIDAEDYPQFLENIAEEVYRILRPTSFCCWWFGMTWYSEVLSILRKVGFKVGDIPNIWYKGGQGQTASPDTMLGSSYEPFFLIRKGMPKLAKTGRSNVLHFDPLPPQYKIHSTERPIELMLEILDLCTYSGAIVCSPFLGSGVTLRAAYKRDMTGYGWDLSENNKKLFINKVVADKLQEEENAEK
jgi:ParB-like chromosome segregation protein Spo0J/DNA modification methylase